MAKRNYNGEGSIYYSNTLGRYVAQFTDKSTQKRKSLYAKTEKEIKKKLRDALSKSENGIYADKSNALLPEIIQNIIDTKYEANITGNSGYLRNMESLKIVKKHDIARIPIQKMTKDDLQKFFNEISYYSTSVLRKVYGLVNNALNRVIEDGLIVKNPMSGIIRPKSAKKTKKIEALTLEEHKEFVNSLQDEPYKNIFLIAINTGMRVGEILALTPNDIDFKNNRIKVTKTITRDSKDYYEIKDGAKTYAGTREIPFNEELKKVLEDSLKNMNDNSYNLLFSNNGNIIRPSSLNTVFKRICKNLGFEGSYNFHMLRHTFATRCIESGMPAHVLQKILGHTDVSTTINTYTSIFDKYKEDEFEKYTKYMQIALK